jgi:indolepyruvate ferredoxin oxidoreductase beta subunit
VIRVAQAKIDPARMQRIAAELAAKPGEPFRVVEFLKPGIEEMCQILPPALARPILSLSARRGWLERAHFGMEIKTTSITGFLRLWLLAKLRWFRPRTHRYAEEQAQIESWLGLVERAANASSDLAIEIAECARLIKGYGSTHKRGLHNYGLIEARVIGPSLDGRLPAREAIDAIASARTAALLDPEGEGLTRCLDELERKTSYRVAAE